MELLKDAAPKVSRVAVLAVSQTPAAVTQWKEIQAAAQALRLTPQRHEITGPDEIAHAFAILIKGRAQGLIVLPHAVTNARRTQIVSLGAEHRLPGMYPDSQYVEGGGLMSSRQISPICIGALQPTWTRFSKGRSLRTCRFSSRRSSSW